MAQQVADFFPLNTFRQIIGIAEIENRQFAIEKIRAIAGQFGQSGVQRGGVGGTEVRLDNLERSALELNQ